MLLRRLIVVTLMAWLGQSAPADAAPRYERILRSYSPPDVMVVDQNGQELHLPTLMRSSEPFALCFTFTTCTTICPIMTATFAHLRSELGELSQRVRLISVSIDPEYDTPRRLREYAKLYGADDRWAFLTGSLENILQIQREFSGYVGDKMDHPPLYIFKAPDSDQWLRIEGLASGRDLAKEIRAELKRAGG